MGSAGSGSLTMHKETALRAKLAYSLMANHTSYKVSKTHQSIWNHLLKKKNLNSPWNEFSKSKKLCFKKILK